MEAADEVGEGVEVGGVPGRVLLAPEYVLGSGDVLGFGETRDGGDGCGDERLEEDGFGRYCGGVDVVGGLGLLLVGGVVGGRGRSWGEVWGC